MRYKYTNKIISGIFTAAFFQTVAAPAQNVDPSNPAAGLDEVIVTGTRRTDRTVTESSVPIDVFSQETLKTQASGDMNEVMKTLVPSFNVGRFSIKDGSTFVRPPTLRGLAPDETLVLVNGKRRHRSAVVALNANALTAGSQAADLGQIPMIAVEHVEVLRDGAAAQYGSDAIAGVVNYSLKHNREGITVDTRVGQYAAGDGQDTQYATNIGLPLGADGFFNVSGEYLRSKQTIRSVQRPDALVLEQMGYQLKDPVSIYGNPDIESYHLFVNAGMPIGPGELYAFGNYGSSAQSGDFLYRRPIDVTVPVPAGSNLPPNFGKSIATVYLDRITAIDPRASSPTFGQPVSFFNANGAKWEASEIYPNGFSPRFGGDIIDVSTVIGYKGEFESNLSYDLSASYGRSQIGYWMKNSLNASFGPDTKTSFYEGKLEQEETGASLGLSYPVEIGLASPLNIAGGVEARREGYLIGQGDTGSWQSGLYGFQEVYNANTNTVSTVTHDVGSNGFAGYGPDATVDESRNSYSAYVDLETDFTQDFTVGLAGRYEHYSDFGSATNGKLSVRYAFNPAIAVRAAASTGFKAPTPGQLFTLNIATAFTPGLSTPYELALLPSTSAAAAYYGATALKPEKSVNYSGGIVLTPGHGFNLTLDYYNISVTDRIGITGEIPVLDANRPILEAAGVRDWATLGRVRYMTNGFATRTEGFDLVGTHAISTGLGQFNSSIAVNYNRTKVTDRDVATTMDGRTFNLVDNVAKGNIEELTPRWRANLGETWSIGDLSVAARGSYYGAITSYNTSSGVASFGSDTIFDLQVSYQITKTINVALGGNNIFDKYPDRETRAVYPTSNSVSNGSVYLEDAPIGFNGAFWYGRVNLEF